MKQPRTKPKTPYKHYQCECGIFLNFYDLPRHLTKPKHTIELNIMKKILRRRNFDKMMHLLENKIKNMLGMRIEESWGGYNYTITYDNGYIENCYEPKRTVYKKYPEYKDYHIYI